MLLQATCVAIGERAVMLQGPPGSGKSTLALKLLDRGARLVGDDGVSLTVLGDRVMAAPAPQIAGLIEVRNVGLIHRPAVRAPVALILRLTDEAPRFVDQAGEADLLGIAVPMLQFDPSIAAAAIRAELALEQFGIRFELP